MDITSIIIVVILFGSFIVPIVWVSRAKKAKEKKRLLALSQFAESHKGKISEYDLWKDRAIGIDREQHFLFFIRHHSGGEQKIALRLSEISKCKTASKTKPGQHTGYDHLDLVLVHRENGEQETKLNFYNSETDSLTLTGELQLIEKWGKIANEELARINHK